MSFAGIGAFMLGTSRADGDRVPVLAHRRRPCAVPLGLLIGLPALRLRGVNLAVVTLAFAATIDALFFWTGFTGGIAGLPIKAPHLFGLNSGANGQFDDPR